MRGQWAIRAKDGTTCYTSEATARVAVAEGYTLGTHRSPVVAALTRPDTDSEWRVIPSGVDQSEAGA